MVIAQRSSGYGRKLFEKLRDGTIVDSIQKNVMTCRRVRSLSYWFSSMGVYEYLEKEICPDIVMRLYLDSILCKEIFCDNFEIGEQKFLKKYLRTGDIFVDVGAHVGLFTLIAAKHVGASGHVYSLEPHTTSFLRLLENIKRNGIENVSCHQYAFSDRNERVAMNVALNGYDAWNSLDKPSSGDRFATEMVDAMTLDMFAEENRLTGRIMMIKIDVEGWERYVISGGYTILSRTDAPDLQVEFMENKDRPVDKRCLQLYRELESLGYSMYVYNRKKNMIIPDPVRKSYPYVNIVATKDPARISARLSGRCF